VERFFAELTHRRLRRGVFGSVTQLRQAILDYVDTRNHAPKPFRWTASTETILGKIRHLCNELR
jgi:hypothetical protein